MWKKNTFWGEEMFSFWEIYFDPEILRFEREENGSKLLILCKKTAASA
jgi:hypothetical protein